jgi:hypothetical protein
MGILSFIKKREYEIFSSFTHTGYQALVRRVNETHTGPVNYKEEEIIIALRYAGFFALITAVELAAMTDNPSLVEAAMGLLKKYGQ